MPRATTLNERQDFISVSGEVRAMGLPQTPPSQHPSQMHVHSRSTFDL
jgi:hypothetical protein